MKHDGVRIAKALAVFISLAGVISVFSGIEPCLRRSLSSIIETAAGQTDDVVDIDEFVANPKKAIGSHVTISGCRIAGFLSDAVSCYAESGRGRVAIEARTFDRESLRQALKNCVGATPSACKIAVSGFVEEDSLHGVHLSNAAVKWRKSGEP